MSSTSPFDALFAKIVAAAERRRAARAHYFADAPDPSATTYFTKRSRVSLAKADFEWPAVANREELGARLRDLWAGDDDLLALVPQIVELAEFRQGGADEKELSDLVYAMY